VRVIRGILDYMSVATHGSTETNTGKAEKVITKTSRCILTGVKLVILCLIVRWCMEYLIQFQSFCIFINKRVITVQFLHYDMFRPLFLAIKRRYLSSQSQLSLLCPPPLDNVYS
jgi:hypothetical protein